MLPQGYKTPAQGGHYMKLEQGENIFRVLGNAVVGWEGWTADNKPQRFRMDQKPSDTTPFRDGRIKHFWAFPVWNYKANQVQILQLTQSTIQKAIEGFIMDEDWGEPKEYDIKITRDGEGLETSYTVSPKPQKPLSDEIWAKYNANKPNLEALFEGKDPFEGVEENINPDDIPF